MRTCPSCSEENPPHARFCLACGTSLDAGAGESRRLVTVLFCDVTDSTALGERQDPEQLRRVLSRYAAESRAVVERHGGTVEKFIGDAVLAVFGIPAVHEDDALRAARAALELRAALARLNSELQREHGVTIETRVGINSGEVIAGDSGRGEGFVTGDVVNVAKRLEENAGIGEILIGHDTYRLARDAVVAELLPPVAAKGKAAPITAYRLTGVTPGALPHARRLDSPMVGRDRERGLLRSAFEQVVRDRGCRLFTILGAAGVGKSRLVAEVLHQIGPEAEVLRGRCLSYGEGITFWPVIEVVKQATGVTDADQPAEARARIAEAVGDDEAADLVAERLAQLVGLNAGPASAHDIFWALRRLLEARARRRPLAVVFDDVNWGEPTFLDLVEHIPDWSHGAPILLVCMGRPELLDVRPGWAAAKPHATTLMLEPLADDETHALIENLVGNVDDAVLNRVVETAEGNPLFVEEMLAMVIEDELSMTSVPATIQVLLTARLDRLESAERRVLECAAVEGHEFHGGAVVALAGQPVGDSLFGLVRKGIVRPHRALFAGEDGFRFRHILLRDAAYDALPKRRRAELHERYADWLERVAHERLLEYEELLGYHLEQAFRCRSEVARVDEAMQALASRAGAHLAAAGRRAAARGDMTAAASLLGRASALLAEAAPERLEVLLELAVALRETGALDQAQRTLVELRQLAAAAGDRRMETYASLDDAFLRLFTHGGEGVEDLRRQAAAAVRLFDELGDEAGLAKAWYHTACASVASARWAEATEALSTALDRARRVGDQTVIRAIVRQLASAAVAGPDPVDEALRRCAELQEEAAEDRLLHARLTMAIGYLEALRGRFDEARGLCEESARTLRELGASLTLATLCLLTGAIELLAGRPEAAEPELRQSLATLTAMGEKGVLSAVAAQLAEALLAQGRDAEAREAASLSERSTTPGDMQSEVAWRSVRAKLAARGGAIEEGLALARDAVALASETDALTWRADALIALATVAANEQADQAAREALRLYRAKGSVVGVRRAEALLAVGSSSVVRR